MKKLSAAIILFVLFCALLLCACKTRPEYVFNNVDRCEYTLTESGDHVANINKEKYLSSAVAPPADAVDIRDHGASPSASASENAKAVNKVKNASVRNVKAVYRDCYEDLHIYRGDKVLEANMDGYPEITRVSHRYFISHALSSYYDLPVYGIYVRDVENFVLENFFVTPRQGNTRALTNFSV